MSDIFRAFVVDALIFVGLFSACLLIPVLYSPRLILRSAPAALQAVVPANSKSERRLSILLGLPFLTVIVGYPIYAAFGLQARNPGFLVLWAYSSGIVFVCNIWDWLVIDWLLVCAITPRWLVIPGTEGHPAYQDYWFHFVGFLKGTVFSAVTGLVAAVVVTVATG